MTETAEIIDPSQLPSKAALRLCESTTTIETIISLTKHTDPVVRQRALKEICPCRVKEDVDDFWKRVLEMLQDPSTNVRWQPVEHRLNECIATDLSTHTCGSLKLQKYENGDLILQCALVKDVIEISIKIVLHTLCDGSPAHLENDIVEALETFNRDPDAKIRRQAHKVISSYRNHGKWNIM